MRTVESPVFDADNHYYEALDAFTRYLAPADGPRVIQWVEMGGRKYHALGGKINGAVTNPTFDPVSPAGSPVARRAPRHPRADSPRVPEPGRPPRGDGRAGAAEDLALPHPRHGLRERAEARSR